jgi:divalent metal cation (Fe/Co/Zn/Cd) transporter
VQSVSLLVLGLTAAAQAVIFVFTDSVALLADLIHNVGDVLTAVPLGVAFALRSARAEGYAGLAVVLAIFISACVAAYEAIVRIINPEAPDHLLALALAGVIGSSGTSLRHSSARGPVGDSTVPPSLRTATTPELMHT